MSTVETTAELLDVGDIITATWNGQRMVRVSPVRRVTRISPLRQGGFDIATTTLKGRLPEIREYGTTEPVTVRR